jgi:DNA repair exonuclease SbcCD ATPase subunit
MSSNELQDMIEDLEAHMAALVAEQAALQRRISNAATTGDPATIRALRPRLTELPDEILQTKIEHQQARLALVEAQRAEDKDRQNELRAQLGPVVAQIKALEASVAPLRNELALIAMRLDGGRDRPIVERRKLEKLLVEQAETLAYDAQAATAPTVRSVWQAGSQRLALQ